MNTPVIVDCCRTAIGRALKTLRPAVGDHTALESMRVPPLASIEAHREYQRALNAFIGQEGVQ